jgi:hypothetical protein
VDRVYAPHGLELLGAESRPEIRGERVRLALEPVGGFAEMPAGRQVEVALKGLPCGCGVHKYDLAANRLLRAAGLNLCTPRASPWGAGK